MKTARQRLAAWGEDLAAEYLRERGFEIVDRNVRTAYGEIDLIARHTSDPTKDNSTNTADYRSAGSLSPALTIFVEVKARTSTAYGYPEASITPAKKAHLLSSAQEYIRLHPELDGEWRVDVISILLDAPSAPPEIQHFVNAVTADGSA